MSWTVRVRLKKKRISFADWAPDVYIDVYSNKSKKEFLQNYVTVMSDVLINGVFTGTYGSFTPKPALAWPTRIYAPQEYTYEIENMTPDSVNVNELEEIAADMLLKHKMKLVEEKLLS